MDIEEYKKTIESLLCTSHSSGDGWIFASIVFVFLTTTAILGNTLILLALHKESSLHPPSKLLYRSLAATDLLVGLILLPSLAYHAFLAKEQRLTELNCFYIARISAVSFTTLSAVSLLTMAAISVDRLLALLLRLRYRHIVTLRRILALVSFFWILSLSFALMMIWEFPIGKSYNSMLILLCIFVSGFCYLKIFLALRQHQTQIHQHQQGQFNGGGIPFNIARYRKTVTTAIWIEGTLIACYLPYSIVIAVIVYQGSSPFLDVAWESTVTLVCLNSSLNPILYCWRINAVKQEVKNNIRQLFCLSNLSG